MKHILFQKAPLYNKRRDIELPKDYNYIVGACIGNFSDALLINLPGFKGQGTKKLDIFNCRI